MTWARGGFANWRLQVLQCDSTRGVVESVVARTRRALTSRGVQLRHLARPVIGGFRRNLRSRVTPGCHVRFSNWNDATNLPRDRVFLQNTLQIAQDFELDSGPLSRESTGR